RGEGQGPGRSRTRRLAPIRCVTGVVSPAGPNLPEYSAGTTRFCCPGYEGELGLHGCPQATQTIEVAAGRHPRWVVVSRWEPLPRLCFLSGPRRYARGPVLFPFSKFLCCLPSRPANQAGFPLVSGRCKEKAFPRACILAPCS